MAIKQVKLVLIGVGNIGRRFLEILARKGDTLRTRYGLELILVGVADSSGAALAAEGLDPLQVTHLKQESRGVAAYPLLGRPGVGALELIRQVQADVLLEASPTNLRDGQPGLGCMEEALQRGMHVVTSNTW